MTSGHRIVSIVTPTYNRAALLSRLASSIEANAEQVREWIVVDDGSTDGTREWFASSSFAVPVIYSYQENSGRMLAVNVGLRLARGELTALMDSDDWLAPDSLSAVVDEWRHFRRDPNKRYAGIVSLCAAADGTPFDKGALSWQPQDTTLVDLSERLRIKGDRKEFLLTNVWQRFVYPTTAGERRVATSTIWPAISEEYYVRFFPRVVAYKEYLRDGLTRNIVRARAESSESSRVRYFNFLMYGRPLPAASIFRNAANYVRYSLHARTVPEVAQLSSTRKVALLLAAPVGVGLYLRDVFSLKKASHRLSKK